MNLTIPPLPTQPRKKNSVYAEAGDVTLFTDNKAACLTVKGMAVVDHSKTFVGASGRGRAFTYLKLAEAEVMLETLSKIVEELRWREKQ